MHCSHSIPSHCEESKVHHENGRCPEVINRKAAACNRPLKNLMLLEAYWGRLLF